MTAPFRRISERAVTYIAAIVLLGVVVIPLLWIVSTAFKPPGEVFASPPVLVPAKPTLQNFRQVLTGQFGTYFLNSLLVSSASALAAVVVGLMASFSFSRARLFGRDALLTVLIVTQLLPQVVLLVPIYRTAASLGLVNTYYGLVIAYLAFQLPVAVWLLRGFVASVPKDIEEAARIDGASEWGAFVRVVVPLARPGVAATACYVFFSAWQDFLYALVFMTSPNHFTVPLGMLGLIGEHTIQWGLLMAASVLVLVPVVVLFGMLQRQFVYGLAQGAVKG